MRIFDLALLRTFVSIADYRTFAGAAAHAGLTQAAVSLQMQRLEDQLGSSLFRKAGRSKGLTEQGERLLRYARDLLALNDEAMRALSDAQLSGSLRIGSPHDVADTLLPPILSQIVRAAPGVRIEIEVGRSPALMEALHRGELDMTISSRSDDLLTSITLQSTPVLWVCSSQFAHTRGQPWPLILIDEPSIFRRIALEALDQHHIPWRPAYRSSNLIGVKAALHANLGITARSTEFLRGPDIRILGERDGLPPLPNVTYYLLARPGNSASLTQQVFSLISRSGIYGPGAAPV